MLGCWLFLLLGFLSLGTPSTFQVCTVECSNNVSLLHLPAGPAEKEMMHEFQAERLG